MKAKETKATVKLVSDKVISDALNSDALIAKTYGKILNLFRMAYKLNKLSAQSEDSEFSAVNKAHYKALGLSAEKDFDSYNRFKAQASKAKAEIKPSAKANAKKSAKKPARTDIVTTPAEEQETLHKANPKDCVLNLASALVRDAKLDAEELKKFFSIEIVKELQKRKIIK